jgi:DNA repair protein RadD
MVELRPYQEQLLEDIRTQMRLGHRRILAVMPTGAGKGTTIAFMVSEAARRGHRVLILAHRAELIADLSQRIHGLGINHGILASGYREDLRHPVQVGSVQTVVRRLGRIPPPSMVIQDEAHHLVAGNMWGRIIEAWPTAFLIGKTATPQRLSGEGLGMGHGGFFTTMVLGPDAAWLTQEGFLAPARVFAPPGIDLSGIKRFDTTKGRHEADDRLKQGQAMGDAVSHYRRTIEPEHNGTAIAFCCSVAHADALADAFRSQGIAAARLDGTMDRGERRRLIADLGAGVLKVLTSCDIVSEGTDIPSVTGAILLRPTDSLGLHLQQVGRVLRPAPGKTHAIVNDHVGNSLRHGLPTDPRDWSLEGRTKRKRAASDALPVKVCPTCFSTMASVEPECPVCGFVFPAAARRELTVVEGNLEEIGAVKIGDEVEFRENGKTWSAGWFVTHIARSVHATTYGIRIANPLKDGDWRLAAPKDVRHPANIVARQRRQVVGQARTREELEAIRLERGYARGWTDHMLRARNGRAFG